VATFANSGADDRHYLAAIDPTSGAASIRFGDGTRGRVPLDTTVSVTYRTGGGALGNAPPATTSPLQDLLQLISDQIGLLEADLEGLYRDQYVETSEGCVVPFPVDGPAVGQWTFSRADGRTCICLEFLEGHHERAAPEPR
jgi:hypothetical protein